MPGAGAIRAAIITAGALSLALGAFHVFLPLLWEWEQDDDSSSRHPEPSAKDRS